MSHDDLLASQQLQSLRDSSTKSSDRIRSGNYTPGAATGRGLSDALHRKKLINV